MDRAQDRDTPVAAWLMGSPSGRAPRLTVLKRHDCGLCEEMLAELTALARARPLPQIDVLDVDSDPVLRRRHGLDIPVLLLEGTVVCRHRLDAAELIRLLRPGPPDCSG